MNRGTNDRRLAVCLNKHSYVGGIHWEQSHRQMKALSRALPCAQGTDAAYNIEFFERPACVLAATDRGNRVAQECNNHNITHRASWLGPQLDKNVRLVNGDRDWHALPGSA